MSPKSICLIASALLMLAACRPKPLNIDVPQQPGTLAISSSCYDGHTVYVSAGYSINSLKKIMDTAANKGLLSLPQEMLLDSGLVTIRAYGSAPDTLRKIRAGLYGRRDLQLIPGTTYTLLVVDYRKGTTVTATTTYLPQPVIDTLYPERIKGSGDTMVKLHLRLRNVSPGSHYFVSYNTPQHIRETATPLPWNAGALYSFVPKQLELFSAEELRDGRLEKTLTLQVKPSDTLFVQLAQIDKAYSNYLAAYKRTGGFINQLTGEPINLPSNIITGLGFFSLHEPVWRLHDLRRF